MRDRLPLDTLVLVALAIVTGLPSLGFLFYVAWEVMTTTS